MQLKRVYDWKKTGLIGPNSPHWGKGGVGVELGLKITNFSEPQHFFFLNLFFCGLDRQKADILGVGMCA